MNIATLIEKLNELDPEMGVLFLDQDGCGYPIRTVMTEAMTDLENNDEEVYAIVTDMEIKED